MGELTAEERAALTDDGIAVWLARRSPGLPARRESLAERVRALADEWTHATCQADGAPCSWHRVSVDCAAELRALLDDPEPPTRDDVYARMDTFIAAAMDGNLAENLTDAWLDGSLARALSGDA